MGEIIHIKKGLDIQLFGKASDKISINQSSELFGIYPDDYPGCKWKPEIKPGDYVKIGTPLLYDKQNENIKIVSPVNGVISDIIRGDRRKIETIIIKQTVNTSHEQINFTKAGSKEDIIELLCQSGLWAMIHQRPYDIIPSPYTTPRDIFITAFDSAPLAGEMLEPTMKIYLEEGIKVLSTLTSGKVYLGVKFGSGISSAIAKTIEFQGPHPAGNVGTQIAAIKPVNKGETVWTLDARTAVRIGKLIADGILDTSTEVTICGELANDPHIVKTTIGASLHSLLKNSIKTDNGKPRVISGNVLTGIKVDSTIDFLHFPFRQITIISEGDDADEFMGWASLSPKKYSVKHSFPAFLRGLSKPFYFDARIKGGRRAMIMSGEYDKVFPMDILPEYLIKAVLAFDIDKMEQLGIYEVAPEDFALPEFVDTSKLELQKIIKEGLIRLHKELS